MSDSVQPRSSKHEAGDAHPNSHTYHYEPDAPASSAPSGQQGTSVPLEHFFRDRFNAEWTPELEKELLEIIACKRFGHGPGIDANGVPHNPDLLVVMDCTALAANKMAILENGENYLLIWNGETSLFAESEQVIVTVTKTPREAAERKAT